MVLLVIIVAMLIHRAADVVRGVSVRGVAGGRADIGTPPVLSPAFPAVTALLLGTSITPGNHVTVLTDLALYDALFSDIRTAKRSITFSDYYCLPGHVADEVIDALAERARAGVHVLFMGDGFACRQVLEGPAKRLTEAGGTVAIHRELKWTTLHKAQHRNHSRLVVIDGSIAYAGGFGVADHWIGKDGEPPWRDTSVRFTGPAVSQVQAAFLIDWAEATGNVQAGESFLPAEELAAERGGHDGAAPSDVAPPAPSGASAQLRISPPVRAGFMYSSAQIGTTAAERLLALSLGGARERIRITNAYFVPTQLLRDLLIDAARRGVDVKLLLPGPRTDVASTRWAGRGFYEDMLRAGVQIYEYEPRMLHAKTMTVDGVWSSIGSMNLDNRSIRLNDEGVLLVQDHGVAAQLDSIFDADLKDAQQISLEAYRARPLWTRFLEQATRLVAPLL